MSDLIVSLNGQDVELSPTLGAARAVQRLTNSRPGATKGLYSLAVAAGGGDIEAIAIAIAACSGRNLQAVEELVFENGVAAFAGQAAEFYLLLSNGGKPLPEGEEANGNARPPKSEG